MEAKEEGDLLDSTEKVPQYPDFFDIEFKLLLSNI